MDIPELPNGNNKPPVTPHTPNRRKPLDLVTPNYEAPVDLDAEVENLTNNLGQNPGQPISKDLQNLKDEYQKRYDAMFGSDADAAERVRATVREQIDNVATRLVNIATNSPNERLAADAAKYLLDRTIFRAGETDDDLQRWLKGIIAPDAKPAKPAPKGKLKAALGTPAANAPEPNPANPDDPALD